MRLLPSLAERPPAKFIRRSGVVERMQAQARPGAPLLASSAILAPSLLPLALLVLTLTPAMLQATADLGPGPPVDGDWVVSGTESYSNRTLLVNGSLRIQFPGLLTLTDTVVLFNSSDSSTRSIEVAGGGSLSATNTFFQAIGGKETLSMVLNGTVVLTNVTLQNATSPGPSVYGIAINGGALVQIRKSTILRCEGVGVLLNGPLDTLIEDTTIRQCGTGIRIEDQSAPSGMGPTIRGSLITDTDSNGIYAGTNTQGLIANTTISEGHARALTLQKSAIEVADGNLSTAREGQVAVFVFGGAPLLTHNVIRSNGTGARIAGGSSAVVSNNTFHGNGAAMGLGVLVTEDSPALVRDNTFDDLIRVGIRVSGGSAAQLRQNRLANLTEAGVDVETTSAPIIDGNVFDGGAVGVRSSSSAPWVVGNTFVSQTSAAVNISGFGLANALIGGNTFTGGNVGVRCNIGGPSIIDNVFSSVALAAIRCNDAAPSVLQNEVSGGGHGIELTDVGGGSVQGNHLVGVEQAIVLTRSPRTISGNTIENSGFGLVVRQTQVEAEGNTYTDSTFADYLLAEQTLVTTHTDRFADDGVIVDGTSMVEVEASKGFRIHSSDGSLLGNARVTFQNSSGEVVYGNLVSSPVDGTIDPRTYVLRTFSAQGWDVRTPITATVRADLLDPFDNVTTVTFDNSTYQDLYYDFRPTIVSGGLLVADEGQPLWLDLSASISDLDDPKGTLGISSDDPAVQEIDGLRLALQYDDVPQEWPFLTVLRLTLHDPLASSQAEVQVKVFPQNDLPRLLAPIPSATVEEGESWQLDLHASFDDEEHPENLTFSSNFPDALTFDEGSRTVTWEPAANATSLQGVVITASEREAPVQVVHSNLFDLSFVPFNDPPIYLGGLRGKQVLEDTTHEVRLDDLFTDEEDPDGLVFTANYDEVVIDPVSRAASWTPTQSSRDLINLQLSAHDATDPELVTQSAQVNWIAIKVDDPPVYRGGLGDVNVTEGGFWDHSLDDLFFDEEGTPLTFSVNKPLASSGLLIERSPQGGWIILWRPTVDNGGENLTSVIITAYDSRHQSAQSIPFNLTFTPIDDGPPGGPVRVETIPAWVWGALIVGAVVPAAGLLLHRRYITERYELRELFLIYHDGRLITHARATEEEAIDEDILASMLTAIQEFVKESLGNKGTAAGTGAGVVKDLDEMTYGDLRIVIERREDMYLAAVIKGFPARRLRNLMQTLMAQIAAAYGPVLENWDGDNKRLPAIQAFLITMFL